ncbi:hypothetical protein Slin15195_G089110 [Septoria linicola]|uniref:Rhodopsin domain-containing protein n=1 Tax=Septoria linicola TaxID=215465 RepID=A0A9Q9EMJ4_9PEZI|nr:hypothetical protein Slin14017_G091760 [Septoria linicola]USW55592.1 hypothetical protein Slin15195_G089110 [Septoria linicola]
MDVPQQSTSTQNDSKQLLIIAVSVVLMVVTLLGISLRIYARLAVLRKVFTDDVLMLFGTLTALGLSATFAIAAYHGYGKHVSQLRPEDLAALRKIAFAIIFLYIITSLLVKTSFLILYLRLDQRGPMRATVYILMFVVAAQNISFLIVQALSCMPPSFLPVGNEAVDRKCWSPQTIQQSYNVNGVLIAIIDAAIFVVPLCMLHGMELPPKQKFAVGGLFALGVLPIAAGCLRCFYTWNAIDSNDIHYDLAEGGVFAQLELHLAILCGSASTFKVLLKGIWPSCCHADDSHLQSFEDLHRRAIELPTPWPTEQHKMMDVAESPVSTDGSWRTWTPPLPAVFEEPVPEQPPAPRLSRLMMKKTQEGGDVAKLPADLHLKIPSIESRLKGRHA